MTYAFNRSQFLQICGGGGTAIPPLAVAYCSLVLIELSLKDHLRLVSGTGNGGHDLPTLMNQLGTGLRGADKGTCNSLSTQLQNALSRMWCQGRQGRPQRVPSHSYPYIRYLRHVSGWPADRSTDADLAHLISVIASIRHFLAARIGPPV